MLRCFLVFLILFQNYCYSSTTSDVTAFSSVLESETVELFVNERLQLAQSRIMIASDQLTHQPTVQVLENVKTTSGINPEILTGKNTSARAPIRETLLSFGARMISGGGLKMHNKFIVIDNTLIMTGSPNVTHKAYNINIESLVAIENKDLADLYARYFQYMQTPDSALLIDPVQGFHASQDKLQVCFPIKDVAESMPNRHYFNIKEFVQDKIQDASQILISMFLISRDLRDLDHDIIASLITASERGCSVEILIDKEQYDTQSFLQKAVVALSKTTSRIEISAIEVVNSGILHDKLILFIKNGEKCVIIGSAGFTDRVQQNENYENMVFIKDDRVFDYFVAHFNTIKYASSPKVANIVTLN